MKRRPKDFDIGTSAHPHQVKKLFRNCWIIGRRFRLAHVKFGTQTIEVATFRRQVDSTELTAEAEIAEALEAGAGAVADRPTTGRDRPDDEPTYAEEATPRAPAQPRADDTDRLIQRDNTYGTPEEDAFRRDFTVNALFYDIGTFSIIDYVGGLSDLDARVIRCIGDPDVRFLEDPVRMLRAVVLAARLEFTIDQPILDAIAVHRHEIARSAPARLLEEYYKILRSGHAEEAMRQLRATKLMKEITPGAAGAPDALWRSIAALDRYRARFEAAPDSLTNAILAGTLLQPLGLAGRRPRFSADALERRDRDRDAADCPPRHRAAAAHHLDAAAPARSRRPRRARSAALLHRSTLDEAITWLEIHGDRPDVGGALAHAAGAGGTHAGP